MKPTQYIFILFMLLVGCSPVSNTNGPDAELPTSTLTPQSAITLSPTETLMPLPTLEPEIAEESVKDLLWNNNDCLSPCFMNMVPLQTNLEDATALFQHLGHDLYHADTKGDIEYFSVDHRFDGGLGLNITLAFRSSILENFDVVFSLQPDNDLASPQEWSLYSPETLIKNYGNPSNVSFALDWGAQSFFEMDVYFEEADLIVQYIGYDIIPRKKGPLEICPRNAQFKAVRIWIGKNPTKPPLPGRSLADATNLTIEDFSKLMVGDPNNACFELNGDVFP